MRLKMILITFLLLTTTTAFAGSLTERTNENGSDKYFHAGFGAIGYSAVYYMLPEDMNRFYKVSISLGAVIAASVAKEHLYDLNANWKDTAGYTAGAVIMIPIIEIKW